MNIQQIWRNNEKIIDQNEVSGVITLHTILMRELKRYVEKAKIQNRWKDISRQWEKKIRAKSNSS